ncbi:MAG: hypothetical protein II333_00445 [Clostridia bacterium]|nr:hypothetical protein [Clostridia bacterium]
MTEFLILLLMQVTVFSSVTALILIAVKQIFRCRIPPLIGTMMWVVLLARLVCPIFPESSISVYNWIPVGRNIMFSLTYDVGESLREREAAYAERENPYVLHGLSVEETVPVTGGEADAERETISPVQSRTDTRADPEEDAADRTERIRCAILIGYAAGIAGMLAYHIAAYFHAKRMAAALSSPCSDERLREIYRTAGQTAGIPENRLPELRIGVTSMVIGCVKPCVICREGVDEREAGMMFAHELIHYKHHDNALLLFSTLIACLYWYNPLIWLVRAMLREDIELLCDSRTLEECGIVGTDYAMMLCRNSVFSELAGSAGCHMSASGRHLKNRLRTISLRNRRKFVSRAGSLLLCAVIILLCLTNPIVSQSSEYSAYIRHYSALTGADERALHLQTNVTVSEYLGQIGTLITQKAGTDVWRKIGGNLEKFKRTCEADDAVSEAVKQDIRRLKTDELLNRRNCALITDCIVHLLTGGKTIAGEEILLLPDVIGAADFDALLLNLTENEANALRSCYNRGVRGADVQFARIYTSEMMDLILSRINDEWMKLKVLGFYQRIEGSGLAEYEMSDEIRTALEAVGAGRDFYILDPGATQAEENLLREIIAYAAAGEDENVLYRKTAEDGCSWETAAFLFYRAGYTQEKMFRNYAEIGGNLAKFTVGSAVYPVLRDVRNITLRGTAAAGARGALLNVYALGIFDADMGILDTNERMSRGESLEAAYRLVYYAVGTDRAVN